MALMAIAAITFASCGPDNDPKDPNGGNNEQKDPEPQPQAADVTIAIGVEPGWFQIADFCIYDSVGTAPAKEEKIVDLYTTWDLGKSYTEIHTEKFDSCTWVFKGYTTTKKFEPNETINFRCELTLKENYLDILQAMEPGTKIGLLAMHVCATQVVAPEYHCFVTANSDGIEVSNLLKVLEKTPTYLEDLVKTINKDLSGIYAYDGFLAGKV